MIVTPLLMFIWFKRVYQIIELKNGSDGADYFLHDLPLFIFCSNREINKKYWWFNEDELIRVLFRIKKGCHNIFISLLNILV